MNRLRKQIEMRLSNVPEKRIWIVGIIAFLFASMIAIISYLIFKSGTQKYTDISAGNITTLGLYKTVDFYAYYAFLISFFAIFTIVVYCQGKYRKKESSRNEKRNINEFIIFLNVFIPPFLIYFFRVYNYQFYKVIIFMILSITFFVSYIISKDVKFGLNVLLGELYLFLSVSGMGALIFKVLKKGENLIFTFIFFLFLMAMFYWLYKLLKEENKYDYLKKTTLLMQIIIPLNLLSVVNKVYVYSAEIYNIKYYARFEMVLYVVIIIFVLYNIMICNRVLKNNAVYSSIILTTIIVMVVVSMWDHGYNLLTDQDQFHSGETFIVYSQIVNHGQIWGKEFVSVLQGLGMIVSALNSFLFYGKFAMFHQTNNLLQIVFAVINIIAVYFFAENKKLTLLFIPVLPLFYFNRGFIIPITFLILINSRLIANHKAWLYAYSFLCIFDVFYQPTYGGVMAACFAPIAFVILYREVFIINGNIKKYFKSIGNLFFILSLGVIFVFSIPLIRSAVVFLADNSYETEVTNGIALIQQIVSPGIFLTGQKYLDKILTMIMAYGVSLFAIGFLTVFFVAYVRNETDFIRKIQGISLTLVVTACFILWLPAILTRLDWGITRISFVSIIIVAEFIPALIFLYWNKIKEKKVIAFFLGIILCVIAYYQIPQFLPYMDYMAMKVAIPAEYIKVSEEEVEGLGETFVTNETYIKEATAIKELSDILLNETQMYYDFTDKTVYYYYSGKKVPGVYASSMICANDALQEKAIKQLKQNDVPLIFINNPLRYILISEPLRSYRIYKYFMDQEYNYINYKGIKFLVREDIDISKIKNNLVPGEKIKKSIDEEKLGQYKILGTFLAGEESGISCLKKTDENNKYIVTDGDPFFLYRPKEECFVNEIDAVRIQFSNLSNSQTSMELFIEYELNGSTEIVNVQAPIRSNCTIIPLFKYPQFQVEKAKINYVRVDFDFTKEGDAVGVEEINLIKMDEEVKRIWQKEEMKSENVELISQHFFQKDLGFLPEQWGNNWSQLAKRFIFSGSTQKRNENATVCFDVIDKLSGKQADFAYIKLDKRKLENCINKDGGAVAIRLNVGVIGKEGRVVDEEFLFNTRKEELLVPLGTSYKYLSAQEIRELKLEVFYAGEKILDIVDDVELYGLKDE